MGAPRGEGRPNSRTTRHPRDDQVVPGLPAALLPRREWGTVRVLPRWYDSCVTANGRLDRTRREAFQELREAYEELARGNVEPLVSLMDDEMEWRGPKSVWRFWQTAPS